MSTKITADDTQFIVKCEYFDNQRAKDLPDRVWSPAFKAWLAPVSKTNAIYIENVYRATEIEPSALQAIVTMKSFVPVTVPFPPEFKFKTEPMAHQMVALQRAYPQKEYALFMDMGTGKTWTAINLAGARYETEQINALVVVCPTSIKPVWLDELEIHCSVDYVAHVHEAGGNLNTQNFTYLDADGIKILIVGVESLSRGAAWALMQEFCEQNTAMMVVDESTTIKTPPKYEGGKAVPNRTMRCWDAGLVCQSRVIMTGTPITQGIQDLFAQFRFLNWEIIGNKNYYSFKARYCQMGGFQQKKIVAYQNVDELMNRVKEYVYSIKITDVMDMPEQVYEQRFCEMNPTQKTLLADLANPYDMSTSMDDDNLECETILERMCRYQQIVGGHFPFKLEDEQGYGIKIIPGKIPKMEELISILDQLDDKRKVVIWARFFPEQKLITDYLHDNYDDASVWYKGGMDTEERKSAIKRFRYDPTCRFFVSGAAGYRGLTLTESFTNIYYSNTFSYDDREQSERRTWRKGQDNSTLYIDLTANHVIDKAILSALKMKEDLAKFVDRELAS